MNNMMNNSTNSGDDYKLELQTVLALLMGWKRKSMGVITSLNKKYHGWDNILYSLMLYINTVISSSLSWDVIRTLFCNILYIRMIKSPSSTQTNKQLSK